MSQCIFHMNVDSVGLTVSEISLPVVKKTILEKVGMRHLWDCDINIDSKHAIQEFDGLLHENFIVKWNNMISQPMSKNGNGTNKLKLYNCLKFDFAPELYVMLNLEKRDRSSLAKFRCGVAPLQVETGRYQGIDRCNRICSMCNLGELEDEAHVLLRCDLYNDVRQNMISYCKQFIDFDSLTDAEKLCFILSDEKMVRYSARVCRIILNRRKYFNSK